MLKPAIKARPKVVSSVIIIVYRASKTQHFGISPSNLVSISMDAYGFPIGLFATNRWVTAEAWYEAKDVIAMLDYFKIDHAFPSWPVNLWISAMLISFRPQIEELLLQRDQVMANTVSHLPLLTG